MFLFRNILPIQDLLGRKRVLAWSFVLIHVLVIVLVPFDDLDRETHLEHRKALLTLLEDQVAL